MGFPPSSFAKLQAIRSFGSRFGFLPDLFFGNRSYHCIAATHARDPAVLQFSRVRVLVFDSIADFKVFRHLENPPPPKFYASSEPGDSYSSVCHGVSARAA